MTGLLLAWNALAQEGGLSDPLTQTQDDKVLLYPLVGILDDGHVRQLRQDIEAWIEREPEIHTVILEVSSPGTRNGEIRPAAEAAKFLKALKGVRVIARLRQDQVAGNASALVALAAREIVMAPGAKLGFWSNDQAKAQVEVKDLDKVDAEEARRLFAEHALLRRVPIGRSHLAVAMVSKHHNAIFKVRFGKEGGNQKEEGGNRREDEVRFLTQEESAELDPREQQMAKKPDVLAVPSGERLTLDTVKAREYGFAVPVESDAVDEVLHKLGLAIGPENIIDHATGGARKELSPNFQNIVDFLNLPAVRFVLILCGILGLLIEFKLPGTLVPSFTGLACLGVFFISGLYKATGASAPTTSIYEVLLFVVGLACLAVELLLLPGVIIFGLSGAAACLISLVLAMVPPASASPTGGLTFKEALTVILASAGTSAILFLGILRLLPRSGFLSRSGIVIQSSIQGTPTADSALEAQAKTALFLGKIAVAITPLRPAGTVELDGRRIDVVAGGDFIEKGEKVEIMEADGTHVLVRRA